MLEIPWSSAESQKFDLAISTSRGGNLQNIHAPLIGAPHGAGYNKQLSREPGAGSREPGAFGLTSEWLMYEGRLIPTVIVLSHEEQRERLRKSCPEAVPRSLVVGDPCMDQLTASLPLRASYRSALGLLPGQKLVVVSSTWGSDSVLGSDEGNALWLTLAKLPVDEFRVLAAVHPNAWYGHGSWQLCNWLAPLLDSGLLLPAPESDVWKAALVAADFLVGDHGSVTMYGVALGIPALLGSFSRSSVAPGSPMERLGNMIPSLSPLHDLVEQFQAAGATQRTDPALDALRAEVTSWPGEAAARLRSLFYEHLMLPEPEIPASTRLVPLPALPRPSSEPPILPAMFVSTALDMPADAQVATAVVRRYPATLQRGAGGHLAETHLVVDHADPDPRWTRSADVLLVPRDRLPTTGLVPRLGGAVEVVEEAAAGCRCLLPGGARLQARWLRAPHWASFPIAASILYDTVCSTPAALDAARMTEGLRVEVTVGEDQDVGLLDIVVS
ncbi:hypothetical protein [Streptacidiphilus sp. P02-A3a]|uniref:hypothetical protein n=1 Tax=Streptacidiphilus sp. P02-A3a TaxID=2704468 RepID=UPI0015FA54D9|nr:hypothetical protein [Streptacidiphilus sp. P02-A3a]QMU69912.1 hypothetical protein GXP74_18495 [Streptacidiphilus sp. P02-A3a]